MSTNKFCNYSELHNESDVEQFFVIKLINELGFSQKLIKTKATINQKKVGKGKKRKSYSPDYILFLDTSHKKPVIIIDAKAPTEDVTEGVDDAQLYASIIRRQIKKPKPEQFCIGINGAKCIVKHYDSNDTLFELDFNDFKDSEPRFEKFKKAMSFETLNTDFKKAYETDDDEFEFIKPNVGEINGIFRACHNLIWKKDKIKPTEAFYEFSKLFFIKLYYDRKIHELIKKGQKPKKPDFIFSTHWIERESLVEKNPVNTILFKQIKEQLEKEIEEKNKKRIFDKDEKINLKTSTIKEVFELLQNYDLFGIDEDLNGRMFETFLSATIRGKELGQFFTPRTVVKFMTLLAGLKVKKDQIDFVLDGCCGSGGFLIESMAQMFSKVRNNKSLSDKEKENKMNQIVRENLWGADADKSKHIKISRIARMNMYLHGDGSNRIYWLPDTLDKTLQIDEETDDELKKEAKEFKKQIENGIRFDVILTNPPFSMKYERKKPDEKRILDQYEISRFGGKQRSALNSNVLFLERYRDLLKPHGKLITIIDESVLNTAKAKLFRDFIRKYFIIKAVISLPRNAFVNADTTVKTSVLYLIKKAGEAEQQPSVFMAISDNVGHNDAGKKQLEKLDLYHEKREDEKIINKSKGTILDEFKKFEEGK